jgi:hypothetical protein
MKSITWCLMLATLVATVGVSSNCSAGDPSALNSDSWRKSRTTSEKKAIQQVAHKNPVEKPATLSHEIQARPIQSYVPAPRPSAPVRNVSQSYVPPPYQSGAVNQHGTVMGGGGYAQTYAPLYPCPVPYVPTNVGGTYITSQYLSPHEMLYPHTYRSMYGPFYWKVQGKYILTPFGVRSHDQWTLQGTEVTVKYRSHYAPFSHFHPPVLH